MQEITKHQDESSTMLTVIARAAADPSVDLEKMQRLLDMQERLMQQAARTAFNADFSQMQNEMPVITERGEIKDKDGRARGKYAKFEDINEAVKPTMQKWGFAISFKVATDAQHITVTGVLMHKLGHREETTMTLPADISGSKNAVQSLGSSISYGQRYVLRALLNISSKGEDTDGVVFISEDQRLTLDTLLSDTKADRGKFLKYFRIRDLGQLPATKYQDAIASIQRVEALRKSKKAAQNDSSVEP